MAITSAYQDIPAAERVGDIRKRDAIQFPDLELASEHASAADAKAAGNEHFKKGQHTMAPVSPACPGHSDRAIRR